MKSEIKIRKFVPVVAAAAIFFMMLSGSVPAAQELKLPPKKVMTLDNGLKVILLKHDELPMVHFALMVESGSASDPAGKAGVASLTAELLRQGTKTRSSSEISEAIDFVGGKLSARASRDASYASCTVLSKYSDTGLDLLSDIILNPTFTDDEFERARRRAISAVMQDKDDPNEVVKRTFYKQLFGEHPYGSPTEGTEASLKNVTRKDVVDFYKTYYRPNNAVLVVVGDIDFGAAGKAIRKSMGGWKRGRIPPAAFGQPPSQSGYGITLVDKPDLVQTHIMFGHVSVSRNTPDYFPLLLGNYIFGGGGFSSRLMEVVRNQKGLTYDIRSQFDFGRATGAFYISTFTNNDSTLVAIQTSLAEFRRAISEPVSAKELGDAKAFYRGFFPMRFETPAQIAARLLEVELYDLGDDFIRNYIKNIDQVTIDDVSRVAAQYWDPDNLVFVVVSNAADVEEGLKTLGKVRKIPFGALGD